MSINKAASKVLKDTDLSDQWDVTRQMKCDVDKHTFPQLKINQIKAHINAGFRCKFNIMGVRGYILTVSDKTEQTGSVEKGILKTDIFA